jgi:hypothetical protein
LCRGKPFIDHVAFFAMLAVTPAAVTAWYGDILAGFKGKICANLPSTGLRTCVISWRGRLVRGAAITAGPVACFVCVAK